VNVQLTPEEARVIGCLMEKSVTTPDQYPLTLNALTNACNQKSSRDPVMSLEPGRVQQNVRQLEAKHLMQVDENFKSRVEKYDHRFCNTPFADLQLSEQEFAVICVLLLRGAQTPGELRTRCNRLFPFPDNQAVTDTLNDLMAREGGPLIARLSRSPGRQDHEYMHLFSGEIESVAEAAPPVRSRAPAGDRVGDLEARVTALEQELGELRKLLQ
jgi:uncharacterized protein YceH (UPF0502 family)